MKRAGRSLSTRKTFVGVTGVLKGREERNRKDRDDRVSWLTPACQVGIFVSAGGMRQGLRPR